MKKAIIVACFIVVILILAYGCNDDGEVGDTRLAINITSMPEQQDYNSSFEENQYSDEQSDALDDTEDIEDSSILVSETTDNPQINDITEAYPELSQGNMEGVDGNVFVESDTTEQSENTAGQEPDISESNVESTATTDAAESKFLSVDIKAVGPNDVALFEASVSLEAGSTVFDVLKEACEESGTELSYTGNGNTAYIVSIGGYAERSEGALSGWIYKVNGEQPGKGCGNYELSDGDRVSFYFTLDLGADVADKE